MQNTQVHHILCDTAIQYLVFVRVAIDFLYASFCSQFGAYSTRFYSGVRPVCRVRKRHEVVGDISTLGEPSLRVFSSPGFESYPQEL